MMHGPVHIRSSADIERDGLRIEIVIEKRSVLLSRLTVVNNGLGGFALGFPRSETVSLLRIVP